MKVSFKKHQSNRRINWQITVLVLMFEIIVTCNSYGQCEDYTEDQYGTLITNRNDPFPHTKLDSTVIPCRKLVKVDGVFSPNYFDHDISQIRKKPYEELTGEDKEEIIVKAWMTGDTTLLNIVIKVAFTDTIVSSDPEISQKYIRKLSIKSLSRFDTDAVKRILTALLKDQEIGIVSALSLAKLGQTEQAFQYIQSNYNENIDCELISDIVSTLMKMNTPDAIKLLMKIAEHKDPSQALDALAALSLLGYCDFSYTGFCRYITNKEWLVRKMVANCLLYYTGSHEAIEVAKSMYYNEDDSFAMSQLGGILKRYTITIIQR